MLPDTCDAKDPESSSGEEDPGDALEVLVDPPPFGLEVERLGAGYLRVLSRVRREGVGPWLRLLAWSALAISCPRIGIPFLGGMVAFAGLSFEIDRAGGGRGFATPARAVGALGVVVVALRVALPHGPGTFFSGVAAGLLAMLQVELRTRGSLLEILRDLRHDVHLPGALGRMLLTISAFLAPLFVFMGAALVTDWTSQLNPWWLVLRVLQNLVLTLGLLAAGKLYALTRFELEAAVTGELAPGQDAAALLPGDGPAS